MASHVTLVTLECKRCKVQINAECSGIPEAYDITDAWAEKHRSCVYS